MSKERMESMKTLHKLLAALCVLALLASLPVTAFAADGPGPADIAATGDDKKIVMPDEASYFDEYKTMYINAPDWLSLSGYTKPAEGMQRPRAVVFHGTRVTALAEQDGFYCVRYRTASLTEATAWIPERFISESYPGTVKSIGGDIGGSPAQGDFTTTKTWGRFPGTAGLYLLLAEPCENCTGFTLDYQVIVCDAGDPKDIMGQRVVSVYNGEKWVVVGSFDYDRFEAVHVNVSLSEPTTVVAVRALPICEKPDEFQARTDAMDFYAA